MVRDGLVFKDENGQVIFNQYSFCELVKHLLVELVGISYEEASQTVERSPLAAPVSNVMEVVVFSHDLPYYWAMFFYDHISSAYSVDPAESKTMIYEQVGKNFPDAAPGELDAVLGWTR